MSDEARIATSNLPLLVTSSHVIALEQMAPGVFRTGRYPKAALITEGLSPEAVAAAVADGLDVALADVNTSIDSLEADRLVAQRKASVFDQATGGLVTSISYGTTTTPVAGTALSNTTYVFAQPFERSGFARYLEGFGLNGGGTLRLKRFNWAGDDFTQVGVDFPVTIPAGYFKIFLETMGVWNVLAGERWGFNAVNGSLLGLIGRTASAFPRTPVYSNTPGGGNTSAFTDSSVDSSSRYEIRLGIDAPTVSEVRLRSSELRGGAAYGAERGGLLAQGLFSPGLFFADRYGQWADSDRRGMKSDLAGLNPVISHRSAVGVIEDKAGFGNRFVAPTNEARPAWVSNWVLGQPVLEFLSDDYLVSERKDVLRKRRRVSIVMAASFDSLSGQQAVISMSSAPSSATTRAQLGNIVTTEAGSRRGGVFRITDAGSLMQLVSPHTPGTNADPTGIFIMEMEIDYEAGVANFFINGQSSPEGQVKFTPVNGGYSDDTDSLLAALGGFTGAQFAGKYGEHHIIVDDFDDQETNGVYAMLGKKYGITEKLKKRVRYNDTGPFPCLTNFWFNGTPILKRPNNKYLLGGVSSGGSVMSADYDFTTGISSPAIRHIINKRLFQNDDHANPSFAAKPDGNVAVAYTRHGAGPLEYWINWTTNPADPLSWSNTPINIFPQIATARSNGRFSYAKLFYLAAEGKYYLIARDWDNEQFNPDGTNQEYWGFTESTDLLVWTPFRRLWGANRPYTVAVQNGPGRIDFAFDEAHPAAPLLGPTNSVRHCYLEGGILHRTDGTACPKQDPWETADLAVQPTLVFQGNPSGLGRAWVQDIAIQSGVPVIGFVTFPQVGVTLYTNRRYRKATYSGGAWSQREICDAGGPPSQGTPSYSGDFSFDKKNPNIIYGSRRVDVNDAPVASGGSMQMFRYLDTGSTFAQTKITFDPFKDHYRPYVTDGLTESTSIVWWNEGEAGKSYGPSYDQWISQVGYAQFPN